MTCKKCNDKECKYRNKAIKGYTIVCNEGCTKEIREESIQIMRGILNLNEEIKLINNKSKPARIFNSAIDEVVRIATNPIV